MDKRSVHQSPKVKCIFESYNTNTGNKHITDQEESNQQIQVYRKFIIRNDRVCRPTNPPLKPTQTYSLEITNHPNMRSREKKNLEIKKTNSRNNRSKNRKFKNRATIKKKKTQIPTNSHPSLTQTRGFHKERKKIKIPIRKRGEKKERRNRRSPLVAEIPRPLLQAKKGHTSESLSLAAATSLIDEVQKTIFEHTKKNNLITRQMHHLRFKILH